MSQTPTPILQTILDICRYAPSSHNTQPWIVEINNTVVTVGFDPDRQLLVGDPEKRELFISLGCFVESFILAAADSGYATTYAFQGKAPRTVVTLEIKQAPTEQQGWSQLIRARRSDRRIYEDRPLEKESLRRLTELKQGDAVVHLYDDKKDIAFLAEQTSAATLATMSRDAFRSELASWIRNNWTKKLDGMPAYVQGIPGPISLFAKFIIKKNKAVARDQAKKDGKSVGNASAVALILTDNQTPAGWIEAGRLYQRLCLTALRDNIKSSGVSAAIIEPTTTATIRKQFDLKVPPVALLRLGYTKDTVRVSPRLRPEDFTRLV